MANPTPGGRIVPIVMPHQDRCSTPPSETEQPESQFQTQLSPLGQSSSFRVTRSQTALSRCLELPSLNERGLYALPTEGDGNCLYYALSDQLYGDFSHAHEIRSRLADHITANKDYFISFISAGGELRRARKRAAALATKYSSSFPSSAPPTPPSAKETEHSFDSKVAESRKNGVWGGAEEIQAFCQSFGADVNVYTTYGVQSFRDVNAPHGEERQLLHIAFHDFNHYSSVRHTHGPHTGLPCIPRDIFLADKVNEQRTKTKKEVDEFEAIHVQGENEPPTSRGTVVNMATPWKISAIQEGLGGKYDRDAIVEMLQQCRGNIDRAFVNLLGECADSPWGEGHVLPSRVIMKSRLQPSSSRSSSPHSTASKRSADDTESEEEARPAVRRARAREKKRRALPDVTVGIAFRDDQNDLVSLRLRVSPDAGANRSSAPSEGTQATPHKTSRVLPKPEPTSAPEQETSTGDEQTPRRSRRIPKARSASRPD